MKNKYKSGLFYQTVLTSEKVINQDQLQVFRTGFSGLDLNASSHFSNDRVVIGFITDNLLNIIERLNTSSIPFEGPKD